MNQASDDTVHAGEDVLFLDKVEDNALERAAGMWTTAVYTVGNCTGLESCPA